MRLRRGSKLLRSVQRFNALRAVQKFFLRYATKAAKPSAKPLRAVQSCCAAFKSLMCFVRFDSSASQPLNVSTS